MCACMCVRVCVCVCACVRGGGYRRKALMLALLCGVNTNLSDRTANLQGQIFKAVYTQNKSSACLSHTTDFEGRVERQFERGGENRLHSVHMQQQQLNNTPNTPLPPPPPLFFFFFFFLVWLFVRVFVSNA